MFAQGSEIFDDNAARFSFLLKQGSNSGMVSPVDVLMGMPEISIKDPDHS